MLVVKNSIERDKQAHFFLVTTPLHLIVSLAIVSVQKIENAHLIFSSQSSEVGNPYYTLLKSWKENPFKSVKIFYRPTRIFKKYKTRKVTFRSLECMIEKYRPSHIYVGNDRNIDFQYCMLLSAPGTIGYYMDEGLNTYVGSEPMSLSFYGKYINRYIRRMLYGFWWEKPDTIGSSKWISVVYASHPELIHPLLKIKEVKSLSLAYWKSSGLIQFSKALVNDIAKGFDVSSFDVIITLPSHSILLANPRYQAIIKQQIDWYLRSHKIVAVKYHPRLGEKDILNIGALQGATLLPNQLPFEAILPMLKAGVIVVSDISTTLITTRLLRPDANARAIDHGTNQINNKIYSLYQSLGIKVLSAVELEKSFV